MFQEDAMLVRRICREEIKAALETFKAPIAKTATPKPVDVDEIVKIVLDKISIPAETPKKGKEK